MEKTEQPVWAKHILKLLKKAKAKDPDFERFGADSHQYKLSVPASEKKIREFEEQQGIRLPEEYRDFLMWIGNGGAGPYYGLYGLKDQKRELYDSDTYCVCAESVIVPKMSDEDWDRVTDPEGRRKGEKICPYAGILPIGSQGCTLMTGLVLNGLYRGQVVYYDEDLCDKPFFVREKGFLAWYERWLREVIAGYDEEETEFGFAIDGDPGQLMEQYKQTENPEEKIEIIDSYYKFKMLPEKQKQYFKQICTQESDMEVRKKLIKMMLHFQVHEMAEEVTSLWEYGAYAEAISILCEKGTWEMKEAWYEKIFEVLPKLCGSSFQDACYILKQMKDYPNVHAERLKEVLIREDLEKNDRIAMFYCIEELKGKEAILDYFYDYFSTQEDIYLLIHAIWAMKGVKTRKLQEIYIKLLDKYKTYENAKLDYQGSQMVLKDGSCLGATRLEGQIVSNLMNQFDLFGLDYREAWKLLMNADRWKEWKQQNRFI